MPGVSAVGRIRARVAPADEAGMPIFALLLSTVIACSALLTPTAGNAQDLATLPAGASSKFEQTAWSLIRDSEDLADFETYLQIYPDGRFALAALRRIVELSEQPRNSRAIVLAPAPSARASAASKPRLPAARSGKSKLAAGRPPMPPRKKPNVVLAPVAYMPAPAAPQQQMPATPPAEPKRVASVASRPATEVEPVDPLDCAMGGMDVD